MQAAIRWLSDNLRTLILAFILAIAVWIAIGTAVMVWASWKVAGP